VISAVLLDVGGVLVMPSHELVGVVAADHGADPDGADLTRGHYEGVAAGERPGGFDWDAYRRALLTRAGVPGHRLDAAAAALAQAMTAPAVSVWSTVLPGVREGLARLAGTGVAVGIVSNADGTIAALLERLELKTGASVVMDSAVVGVDKPDPRIFALALDALGVAPQTAVHVGDTIYADVAGALAAGVAPVHVDPIGWCGQTGHRHVAGVAGVAAVVADEDPDLRGAT
jgi:putative hydrolase of the HAD superfamily